MGGWGDVGSGATTALRMNNAVAYFLPKGLGGIDGEAMVAPADGAPGNQHFGARLGYNAGASDISAAHGTTKTATTQDFKPRNTGASGTPGSVTSSGRAKRNALRAASRRNGAGLRRRGASSQHAWTDAVRPRRQLSCQMTQMS